MSGLRPNATQLRQFSDADKARAAARANSLFSLDALNSQSDWNSRTDQVQISLQYAQAYMAVRYLNETYSPQSAKNVVVEIGRGFSLPDSIKSVTGLELSAFESQFSRWLEDWEDPGRASIGGYLSALELILSDLDAILDERSRDLSSNLRSGQTAIRRAARLNSIEALIDRVQSLSPPEGTLGLHQEAEEYLVRVLDWLTLEFKHADTRDDSYRVAANAMLPEINARKFLLQRNISNLEFIYHLGE
ncbi:MAG: hypothetical protein V3S68_02155 [Dehalococcoidia bacterium]